jgi:nucleoid-associated protein YgaU
MKRISLVLMAVLFAAPLAPGAQDAAVEERLNKLSAQIQDLIEAKDAQTRRIEELARQLRELQEQGGKPGANYASAEDVKQLAAKLQELDRKRQDDNELILRKIEGLSSSLKAPATPKTAKPPASLQPRDGATPGHEQEGFEYVVQAGDNLSAITKAYAEKGIKIKIEDILKANPGLVPEKMKTGQKIFIPAPKP